MNNEQLEMRSEGEFTTNFTNHHELKSAYLRYDHERKRGKEIDAIF